MRPVGEKMASNSRIYIDSCYYIDVAKGKDKVKEDDPGREEHLPYVEWLLVAALNGDIEIVASTLTIAECLHTGNPQDIPEDAKDRLRRILTSGQGITLVAPDVFIAERARDLLWVDGINCGGGADGVHVATAIDQRCEEFLTTNTNKGPARSETARKLSKLSLRVIEATQTEVLPPEYIKPLLVPKCQSD